MRTLPGGKGIGKTPLQRFGYDEQRLATNSNFGFEVSLLYWNKTLGVKKTRRHGTHIYDAMALAIRIV